MEEFDKDITGKKEICKTEKKKCQVFSIITLPAKAN